MSSHRCISATNVSLQNTQDEQPQVPPKETPMQFPTAPRQRSGTLSSLSTLFTVAGSETPSEGLAPPAESDTTQGQGSIALRAMKSMRSIAHMKSWANLGGSKEGNTKEGNNDTNATTFTKSTSATIKTREKGKKTKEKSKKKEKETEAKKADRNSTSSFEAGALSPQSILPVPDASTLHKKPSKLSLAGLIPGTMRLGTARQMGSRVSSTSSTRSGLGALLTPTSPNSMYGLPNARLSAGSATQLPDGRSSSAYSTISSQGSSLRPPSTASGTSASAFSMRSSKSSNSSVSVRWDENTIAGVKETQRRERGERRNCPSALETANRRSAEGRRRTTVTDLFPEMRSSLTDKRTSMESNASSEKRPPVLTVDSAPNDGHDDDDLNATPMPVKRARPRPMSEQLLGKSRPKPISDDADGECANFSGYTLL